MALKLMAGRPAQTTARALGGHTLPCRIGGAEAELDGPAARGRVAHGDAVVAAAGEHRVEPHDAV